ncbi:hypothetical protein L596_025040 [Steinernema carpocapsae]|uniref:DAGKc domain-containing protein n=1 Tax=Steinernema carpocapsae TaxID=34508 RepID=A0A4U5M6M9_STECR|nr:hypothetical protein L596_025040 [Steinernema carpocapsae]
MAAIATKVGNAGKTLWRHKKKSAVAGIALYHLGDWLHGLHRDQLIRTAYAREALKFGVVPISCEDTPRRVTVLVNINANERHVNDKFTKNALPLLHLAGLQVDVIKAETPEQLRSLAAVIDKTETDAIFVVGGDGTLAEVLTGIFEEHKPERGAAQVPIGVFPGGNDNRSLQLLIPDLFQGKDDVRLQCESAMAVIENSVTRVRPFKCSITSLVPVAEAPKAEEPTEDTASDPDAPKKLSPEKHADGAVFYALSDVTAGWFNHIEQRKHKLWYWFGWKRKFAYFWEMLKRSPEPLEVDVAYEEFCTGCRRCRPAIVVQEKPAWRWWHMFTGTPRYANPQVRKDYSNIVNENCGRQHTDKVVASDLVISNIQSDPAVSETGKLVLIANDGANTGRFDVISDGWKRCASNLASVSTNPDFYTTKLSASAIELFVKFLPSFIPKLAVAGEWRTLEDCANKKVRIEATDKVVDLFVPRQLRFDHESAEQQQN